MCTRNFLAFFYSPPTKLPFLTDSQEPPVTVCLFFMKPNIEEFSTRFYAALWILLKINSWKKNSHPLLCQCFKAQLPHPRFVSFYSPRRTLFASVCEKFSTLKWREIESKVQWALQDGQAIYTLNYNPVQERMIRVCSFILSVRLQCKNLKRCAYLMWRACVWVFVCFVYIAFISKC